MENTATPNWSVIRLTEAHIEAMVDHYMQLSQHELYLRFFGGVPTPLDSRREYMTSRVTNMFERKMAEQLGIVDPSGGKALIGVASWGHCSKQREIADFGVSVVPAWRGKGLTEALADRACIDAAQAGCTTMRVSFLYDNAAVRNLLRRLGKILPLNWGMESTSVSLQPYTDEVRRQLDLLAALLEAFDLSGPPAKL